MAGTQRRPYSNATPPVAAGRRRAVAVAIAIAVTLAGCGGTEELFGAELYREACATCHDRAEYDLGPGSDSAALEDADLEHAIRFGRTGMPAFDSSYTDEQIAGLVSYLRRLQAGT